MNWGLAAYLSVGAGLAALALLALLLRRDLRGTLLAMALLLAAAVIDVTVAGQFLDDLDGAIVALLVLALGGAQFVVLTAQSRGAAGPDDPGGPS